MRNEIGREVLCVDDTTFELGPCGHCGAIAGEEEAAQALAEWRKSHPGCVVCACCGQRIRLGWVILDHASQGFTNGPKWTVMHASFPDSIPFTDPAGAEFAIHKSCALSSLKFAVWDQVVIDLPDISYKRVITRGGWKSHRCDRPAQGEAK